MRHLLMALGTYGSFVLQAGLAARAPALPDFLAITALFALLIFDDWRGLVWLGFTGFLADCLSSGRLGPALAGATIAGCLADQLWFFERRAPWLIALWAGGLVFVTRTASIVLNSLDHPASPDIAAASREIATCAGATAALALLVALLLKRLERGEGKDFGGGRQTFSSYCLVPDGDA